MNLILFFSRRNSLKYWVDTGLFDREKLIYERHLANGTFKKIYWLTYGCLDGEIAASLKSAGLLHNDIYVIPMPKIFNNKIGNILYSLLCPFIQWKVCNYGSIFKTNQMDGSYSGVIAMKIHNKPLIVRTGYTASIFARHQHGSLIRIKIYEWMESLAYGSADVAVVASLSDKNFICDKYKINPQTVHVFNNYINTTLFRPKNIEKYSDRIVFVGRMNKQKNVDSLIRAVSKTQLTLDIYGSGELMEELQALSITLSANVRFMGVVPNSHLPDILNKYRYFILPSHYEGMPKTLLEAMACGLVCIGTDVEGIREVIEHKVTGYLAKTTDWQDIYNAIMEAQLDDNIDIIAQGVTKIETHFSLEGFLTKEVELIRGLIYE